MTLLLQPSRYRHRYPIAQQKPAVQEILLHCRFFARKKPRGWSRRAEGEMFGRFVLGAILAPSDQTLVIGDTAGDGPGYIVKIPQQQESVVAVDEADLDERGWHRCAAQDGERGPGEDAAVLESLVERVERAVQLVLDGASKLHAGGIRPIALRQFVRMGVKATHFQMTDSSRGRRRLSRCGASPR